MSKVIPKSLARAIIESLRIGPEKNFTYLILCPATGIAALVDPAFEPDRVMKWVNAVAGKAGQRKPHVSYLMATHGHWDHAGGFPDLLRFLPDAKVVAHGDERERLKQLGVRLDKALTDGERFFIGDVSATAFHTPGHTEGGCSYLIERQLFSGDTLFVGQCGRTDLPGGSNETLFKSLQRLKTLPGSTVVRPGHDYGRTPQSTIEEEIKTNPTMMAKTLQEFIELP